MRTFPILAMALLLAGCGGDGGTTARPAPSFSQPEPHIVHHPGQHENPMAGVIGADAEALVRRFGPPRLDIREGDARKLQWLGPSCVLDAYLYPGEHGGRAVATYVEARRGDGQAVDRTACVVALRKN